MSLTKVSYSMISGTPINVCDHGFSTTNTASQNSAILLSLLPGGPTGIELVIPEGDYALNPLVLENMSYVTIRGIGRVNLAFTTGTAAITLGDAARTRPVRRCIFDNLRIIGSGALTYGVRMLFAVDICMYNVTIEDDNTTFIDVGLYIDYSYNNNFYQLIVKAKDGIVLSDDEANNNNFFGGRCDPAVVYSGVGIRAASKANAFYGFDAEAWQYGCIIGRVLGFTLSGCYFEGNFSNDIFFDGSGPAYSTNITGCFFDTRTNTSDAIQQNTIGSGSSGVVIQGNNFVGPPANAFIRMTSLSNDWFIAANSFLFSSNYYSGIDLGTGNQIQNLSNTWTPVFIAGSSGTPTTTESSGRWIKQGRLVTAWFQIKGSSNGATGSLAIDGLPFVADAALNGRGYSGALSQALGWGTATPKTLQKGAANDSIDLYDANGIAITVANMGVGDNEVVGMVTYFAAN